MGRRTLLTPPPDMKTWVVSGDLLEIADGDLRVPVTAEEVYASILEESPAWPDLQAGKCGDAVGLEFSPYPVDLMAVLSTGTHGSPCVTFEAQTQMGHCFPISKNAIRRGHIIHGETWYPLAPGSDELIDSLPIKPDSEAGPRKNLTLKECLSLKKTAAEGGPVIDRVSDGALKKMLCATKDNVAPEGITAKLYRYQLDGWRWLQFILEEELGGLLADEMGLGKTLQVISALKSRSHARRIATADALVIAPSSLLENWIREIAKFCPRFKALKHSGPSRTGIPAELTGYDIVVTSYESAVRDLSLLKMNEWNVIILDEAQNIRNPNALRTRSVKQLRRRSAIAVTGTPIENRLRDLWSIVDFVLPGYLGTLDQFELRYSDHTEAAVRLEPVVSPLILRRRVKNVAPDLPARIDIPEVLEMTNEEANLYELARRQIFEEYGMSATIVSLGKLRQFCAHPALLQGNDPLADSGEFSKFERLMDLVAEIIEQEEKALIFTSWIDMADHIANAISRELGVMAATFDGRLDVMKRQPLIDQFSTSDDFRALVLNPRVGGAGLNIVAANHVIHYNPEWNPALEDQASARVHRRGQERPVTVRRMIVAGTVEEVIDERLRRKRDIADAATVGVDGQDADFADIIAALERSPV